MKIKIQNKKLFADTLSHFFPQQTIPKINALTIDSRQVGKDDIFLPLNGEHVDGHDFIKNAIDNGASIVFSEKNEVVNNIILQVPSTKDFLTQLAQEWRKKILSPVFGITGTNGKTTTKELLSHALSSKMKTLCTNGNYNSTIGMPISLFSYKGNEDICILEMGASEPGEISELCEIAQPTMGIITNISNAHTEKFGTIGEVACAKAALFKSLPFDGFAFMNMDDVNIQKMRTDAKVVTYGFNGDVDYKGVFESDTGIVRINGYPIQLPFGGWAMAQNILGVFSIAETLGLNGKSIIAAIESFSAPSGRGEIIYHNGITIIDDSYNANLASAKAGIDFLISTDGKRKIAVLGDMFELGNLAITEHIKLGRYASDKKLDAIFATGELTKSTITEARRSIPAFFYKSKTKLIESLKSYLQAEDVVYVKGSRGMKMEEVIREGLCK